MLQAPATKVNLLNQKLAEELASLEAAIGPQANRNRQDILAFQQNIGPLLNAVAGYSKFALFDFQSKKEIHKVDLGPEFANNEEELEFELFDALRVSNEVPFVVLNVDRHKIKGVKGLYLSRDRRFKIYHSKDAEIFHEALIPDWATMNKLNVPHTMIIKVLMVDEAVGIPAKKSYIDVVYRFGEGLFIEFKSDREEKNVNHVIDVLQRHLMGFQPSLAGLSSISGSFIVDRLVVEPALFRGILVQPHNLQPNAYPLLFSPVLWVVEKSGQSLAFRKQFILNFKLGDVTAKVIISEKIAENKNVHYLNGVPVTLVPDTHYNHITISEVQREDHALLVRDILTAAFYLYGVPEVKPDGAVRSRSMEWAAILNYFIGGPPTFAGAVFSDSKLVTTEDIKAMRKNIARLKAVDPTFYGSIATAKAFGTIRQPSFVVSTSDPNWQQVLWNTVDQVYRNDASDKRRQIIRYPLDVIDASGESLAQIPITKVPPYFLICSPESPFFSMKINKDPVGSRGTFHPYLPSCMTTQSIMTPGADTPQDKFTSLANLNVVFVVQSLEKPKSERSASSYEAKTQKILKPDATGILPSQVERVLMSGFGVNSRGEAVVDLQFRKIGMELSMDSLLHILIKYSIHRPDLQQTYASRFGDTREEFLKQIKKDIAKTTNWNYARQEFFDMDAQQIRDNFLRPDSPVDSRLYKTILEKYFNVYLLIIRYEDFKSYVEVPRHKFLYIPPSYPANVQPMVIFKNLIGDGDHYAHPQYEYVEMLGRENPNSILSTLPWNYNVLKTLFDLVNRTSAVSFMTMRLREENQYQSGPVIKTQVEVKASLDQVFDKQLIQSQFIDGAGKLRAFVLNYPDREADQSKGPKIKQITISVEPLAPLGIASFDDTKHIFVNQDFQETLKFLQTVGIKLQDVAYRMESEEVEVIEEIEQENDEAAAKRIDAEKQAKREKARQREIERSVSIKDRLLGGPEVVPGGLLQGGLLQGDAGASTGLTFLQELKAAEEKRKAEAAKLLAPIIPAPTVETAPKKAITVRVIKKSEGPTMAVGVWFTLRGLRFYIATTPGQPPTENYSIDNIPYFEVNPSSSFRQHDYYERVANIMVQLVRNLYLYSRVEDPQFFIDTMVVINPDVVYDLATAKRRIPASRNFNQDLLAYAKAFPTFFTPLDGQGDVKSLPRFVADSYVTKQSLLAHLKIMQQLKEDVIGASGSKVIPQHGRLYDDGMRRVVYEPFIDGRFEDAVVGITDRMIEKLVRLKEFYLRPAYIVEFYSYASDFTVRGPDQNVFMTEDEVVQYMDLTSMDVPPSVISAPVDKAVFNVRPPMYFVARDGSLYILQNVQGGNRLSALNVLHTWETQRVNLGFFAPEHRGNVANAVVMNMVDLPKMDVNQNYILVEYKPRTYAALFKLSSPVVYGESS